MSTAEGGWEGGASISCTHHARRPGEAVEVEPGRSRSSVRHKLGGGVGAGGVGGACRQILFLFDHNVARVVGSEGVLQHHAVPLGRAPQRCGPALTLKVMMLLQGAPHIPYSPGAVMHGPSKQTMGYSSSSSSRSHNTVHVPVVRRQVIRLHPCPLGGRAVAHLGGPTPRRASKLGDDLEVELVHVALSVHLVHNLLVIVVAYGPTKLVVIHARLPLSYSPEGGYGFRVHQLELPLASRPGDDAGMLLVL